MYPDSLITKSITIPKLIRGIGKTLSVANRVIPLYKQAKPMVQNAKNAFSIIKEFKNTTVLTNKKEIKYNNSQYNNSKKSLTSTIKYRRNGIKPQFFV